MSAAAVGGKYIVEEALGRGGMGVVYRVRDARTGARLALKRAWARDPSKALRRRAQLEREFHTLAQLRHPRIIEVYDFGVDENGPYYTMELLDGADLDRTGQLPWRTACSLISDIASSLAILHSRGLLHRDVSSHNVRQTGDGHAKLIDFGTMASIGVLGDTVGTPPFMPPEAVQMQALDARADLFSLGALAYHALTGRHAFPASRPSDLRDVWRSRPMPPQRIVPDLPPALGALVLQLLALDRAARPENAAEVMERLRAIAGLPKEDLPQITRAYLTTPGLIGRDQALLGVRGRMLSLVRGEGGVVLIEGPAGSGRSRMLDACVFEAKVLGAYIARVSAQDSTEAWGTARRLCSQLFSLMPDQALIASRLGRNVLHHVVDEVADDDGGETGSDSVMAPERSVLLRELRDFFLALGSQQRLVIVVDDADRIDEPSSALLAALADKTDRQQLLIALAMEPETNLPQCASERLLRRLAHRIELQPLEPAQTVALVRSVFGDVPNLELCAGKIHGIAQGSPRASIELAQSLVDRGLARYEAGRWSLPARLDVNDLPDSLSNSLRARLQNLGPAARELAEALAIAEGLPLGTDNAEQLMTGHKDSRRMFEALQELVSARVVVTTGGEPRFSQRGFARLLVESMPEARSRALHARFAEFIRASGGDPLQRVHHLFEAGREPEALEVLCGTELLSRRPPIALIERAIDYAESHPQLLAARALLRLRMALLAGASASLAAASFERCLPHVLRQLERDSGLESYRELSGLPPEQRLTRALAHQQERYLATTDRQQGYGAGDAIRELARLIGVTCSMAGSVLDLSLLDRLPSLEPLLPLTPALRVVAQTERATRELIRGAHTRSQMNYEAVLARIEEPDRAGLDAIQHARTRLAVHYTLALIDASVGLDRAEERARILEGDRALRVSAWRIRSLLALNQGNVEAARKYSRRAELLRLQDEQITQYVGTDAALELTAFERIGDLFGVKSALDTITVLGQSYPGWHTFVPWAQSSYRFLQGDLQAANEWITLGTAQLEPGRDLAYGGTAIQHVRVMRALGPTLESVRRAREYVANFEKHELTLRLPYLKLEVSLLEAQAGESASAIERIAAVTAQREADGARGFVLGIFHETRARIAIWMRDTRTFEEYAAKCATEYARGPSPHLQNKYTALIDEARQREVSMVSQAPIPAALSLRPNLEDTEAETLRNRMLECVDAADRARCALTMLLQNTDSYLGYLYGVEASGLVPLAGLPETRAEPDLEAWLASWVVAECERNEDSLQTGTASYDSPSSLGDETHTLDGDGHHVSTIYTDSDGRRFCASTLSVTRGTARVLVALLAVQITGAHLPTPRVALCTRLASHLLEQKDVAGIEC